MKAGILLLALIATGIIAAHAQINRKRNTETANKEYSFYPKKANGYFGKYTLANKFNGLNNKVAGSLNVTAKAQTPADRTREMFTGDNMPCLKPEGIFPMSVYKPDSTITYTMLVKKSLSK